MFKVSLSPGDGLVQDLSNCQRDINVLYDTARSWGLEMNMDKCSVIHFGRDLQLGAFAKCARFSIGGRLIRSDVSSVDLGVTIDSTLRFHDHIATVVRKAGGLATNLLRSTLNREASFMITLFVSHVRPVIDYCSCLWHTGYTGDLHRLESVQRRWTRKVSGLEDVDYATRLRRLDLYSIKGRLLRTDLIRCWKIFNGKCVISTDQLFSPAQETRTRGHLYRVGVARSTLECRRRSFAVRSVGIWNSLPQDVVSSSSLSTFKSLLHDVLAGRLFEFV